MIFCSREDEINKFVEFAENDEWDLKWPLTSQLRNRSTVRYNSNFTLPYLSFQLEITRRHRFYVIIFVVPNALLYVLSGLVFFIPPESGEKISFAITILLAQFVSLAMISDILPSSSRSFPKMGYFCGWPIVQSTINLFLSVIGEKLLSFFHIN